MSFEIVIVGAGLSGTLMALELARQESAGAKILLVGQDHRPGLGLAYGTQDPAHLLNTPASKMSLFAHDPEHFVKWLEEKIDRSVCERDASLSHHFAPRSLYGTYIQDTWLEEAKKAAGRLVYQQGTVIDLETLTETSSSHRRDGAPSARFRLSLEDGQKIEAQQVILALGFDQPQPLGIPVTSPDLLQKASIANPWDPTALKAIPPTAHVLLVGTGLTACDVMLSLLRRGHTGLIVAVSRHGLLPQEHAPNPYPPWPYTPWPRGTGATCLSAVIRDFRRQCDQAEAAGSNWRAVLDGMRPYVPAIWQCLSIPDKKRFLRHIKTLWNVHRHRIPYHAMAILRGAIERGQIHIHKAKIAHIHAGDEAKLTVHMTSKGQSLAVGSDWIINCTGPSTSPIHSTSPLIQRILSRRIIKAHPLGLGLSITDDSLALSPQNRSVEGLYVLGPWCIGHLWEATAVPEIRNQAHQIAGRLSRAPLGTESRLTQTPTSITAREAWP